MEKNWQHWSEKIKKHITYCNHQRSSKPTCYIRHSKLALSPKMTTTINAIKNESKRIVMMPVVCKRVSKPNEVTSCLVPDMPDRWSFPDVCHDLYPFKSQYLYFLLKNTLNYYFFLPSFLLAFIMFLYIQPNNPPLSSSPPSFHCIQNPKSHAVHDTFIISIDT